MPWSFGVRWFFERIGEKGEKGPVKGKGGREREGMERKESKRAIRWRRRTGRAREGVERERTRSTGGGGRGDE
jgi:hypothetical protein